MAMMATTVYEREIGAGTGKSFSVRAVHEGTCTSYKTISSRNMNIATPLGAVTQQQYDSIESSHTIVIKRWGLGISPGY